MSEGVSEESVGISTQQEEEEQEARSQSGERKLMCNAYKKYKSNFNKFKRLNIISAY